MYVDHLQLVDFRSYEHVELPLHRGVTVFVGANGQGKTNLVEAVDYLASLGSHRVSSDAPLVRAGAEQAIVRARVRAGAEDDRAVVLEVEINPGRANRARLNRSPVPRPRELLGILRTVLFAPDDLAIVKGDPAERRRFLDAVVTTRWPRLAGVRGDYDRILRQRNTLLKSLGGRRGQVTAEAAATLDVWNDHLARVGSELLQARLDTLAELMPYASQAYADIAPSNNVALAEYRSRVELPELDHPIGDTGRAALAEALLAAMAERRSDEVARGVSLVGPHRDDVELRLGDLPAKGYASHGESWSYALSLKLGSFHLLQADGVEPVLILDDVFAELDTTRRERLAASVAPAEQLLVTAAVAEDVPEQLVGVRCRVADRTVTPDDQGHRSD
ncbi:DNA replication/repair protein RecF [Propionibacteriaceae bacterium Y2011]|uniref:DNA replication/repair protein RecF n=1 Tax=Microlunatus sp. Y2014 TaxID=3418488 RepID=UPI003B4EF6B9